jgi:serine/threonine protein kinase
MSEDFGRPELSRYSRIGLLGQGAYGKVYKAHDTVSGEFIAMKKTLHDFEREGVPTTVLREICLLRELKHDNIVNLKDVVVTEHRLYLIFEYVEYDLRKFLKEQQGALDSSQLREIMKQILIAVYFCHSRRVLHRDLKPDNVLISANMQVKIADFGLARVYQIPIRPYTNEVQTLWYRAPELLLEVPDYSVAVDMWSVGCIMADLYRKMPLFKGSNAEEQWVEICRVMGTPTEEVWPGVSMLRNFAFTPAYPKQDLSSFVPQIEPTALDLLQRMLTFDPASRISAKQALQHPYFA